jgi:hypothetical protein
VAVWRSYALLNCHSTLQVINFIFALVGVGLQVWILGLLVHKRQYRTFGFFAAYTMYSVLTTLARTVLSWVDNHLYVVVYWLTEIPYAALGVAAMYQAFNAMIRRSYVMWWVRLFLPTVVLATILMAIVHVWQNPPVEQGRLWAAILAANITVRNLQVGMFVLFLGLSKMFHIPQRKYGAGIVNGFGIAALGMLLSSMVRSAYGMKLLLIYQLAPAVSYIIALLLWLNSLRNEEQLTNPFGEPPPGTLAELNKGKELIGRLLK